MLYTVHSCADDLMYNILSFIPAGGPAELYNSDEDFEEFIDDDHLYGHAGYQTPPPDDDDFMSDQDAFLDNDDPLEYERFDLS